MLNQKINTLDLTMVKKKLCRPVDRGGQGWTKADVAKHEVWYKRFLHLKALYKGTKLVPTLEIDTMWHAHILDTWHYTEHCQEIFGCYLHHDPYFGLRSEAEAQEKRQAFKNTMDLFFKHFKCTPPIRQPLHSYGNYGDGGMDCA